MIVALVALALALAAAAGTAVVLAVKMGDARAKAAGQEARADSLVRDHGEVVRKLRAEVEMRLDERERYERALVAKDARIRSTEDELTTLTRTLAAVDPAAAAGAVGNLLDGILSSPPAGSGAAGSPTAVRPAAPAAPAHPAKDDR